MTNEDFRCPFCGVVSRLQQENGYTSLLKVVHGNKGEVHKIITHAMVCLNSSCRKYALRAESYNSTLRAESYNAEGMSSDLRAPLPLDTWELLQEWQLIPDSNAMPMPDYIPESIRDDYNEACAIVTLSPKASATLSRRCLQGMIRDFFKTKQKNLYKEIESIKDKLAHDVFNALHSVRSIANIGAHPDAEQDINLIVGIEPHEAEQLIKLIEMLIRDWYIARQDRKNNLQEIKAIAAAKETQRKADKPKT